jgi:hypothetical protein
MNPIPLAAQLRALRRLRDADAQRGDAAGARQWQAEIDALRAQQQRERVVAVLEALRATRPSP